MIKVLFLIEGLSGGGAEKVLRNLVNNMQQSEFDITVQTINKENAEEYLVPGIHYKAINRCKSSLGKKLFSYFFRINAELKLAYPLFIKGDYDIEIAYLETISTKIIAQSTNKTAKKIAWVHCDLSLKEGISKAVWKLSKQYDQFDDIICVSEDVKNGFVKLFTDSYPLSVLGNVIDDTEIQIKASEVCEWTVQDGIKKIIAIGRLSAQKNFAHLISTCAKLKDAGHKYQLYILGEGPEHDKLEKQICDSELEDYVSLKGFCKNPYNYLKSADLLVCSSLYEGISTVVQEALLLGIPVVTTPCTGMHELLGDSEYGMIVEKSENGLYNGMSQLLQNSELLDHYTVQAKKRAKDLNKSSTVTRTEEWFKALLNNQ